MEKALALEIMSALSQRSRFDVLQALMATGPDGMSAGQVAVAVGASPSAMSAQLAILSRANLILADKRGRSVNYRARPETIDELGGFLNASLAKINPPTRS